jgi:hypothetical protein
VADIKIHIQVGDKVLKGEITEELVKASPYSLHLTFKALADVMTSELIRDINNERWLVEKE